MDLGPAEAQMSGEEPCLGARPHSAAMKRRSAGGRLAGSLFRHRAMRRVDGMRAEGGRVGRPRRRRFAQRWTIS